MSIDSNIHDSSTVSDCCIVFLNEIRYGALIEEALSKDLTFFRFIDVKDVISHERSLSKFKHKFVLLDSLKSSSLNVTLETLTAHGFRAVVLCEANKDVFTLMNLGAASTIVYPASEPEINDFVRTLKFKLRMLTNQSEVSTERVLKKDYGDKFNKIIVIGSSTGGTEALKVVLNSIPANCPPIIVVQHMPMFFTRIFSERLHLEMAMTVWEAKDNDVLKPGICYIAPGGFQMRIVKSGGVYRLSVLPDKENLIYIPSVDVLFESAAQLDMSVIAVIMTGMGNDGAKGLLKLRNCGAYTIGQNKESSVVYGMPKAAFELGAVIEQVDLAKMADAILKRL